MYSKETFCYSLLLTKKKILAVKQLKFINDVMMKKDLIAQKKLLNGNSMSGRFMLEMDDILERA